MNRLSNFDFSVRIAAWAICLLLPTALSAQDFSKVANTKHNLTASGPGPIKVAGAGEVCYFCHTPHSANPIAPLWNRQTNGQYYDVYGSSTMKAEVPQPTGSSRLCLSCHDGTIALTQTYNPRVSFQGTIYITPQDSGYLGTDLRDDHPISFVYDQGLTTRDPQLRDPLTLPKQLPLDAESRVQCTTCHDAHDDSLGFFLRMDNRESAMCVSCHNVTGWTASVHATSGQAVPAGSGKWGNLTYGTVRELACEACHRPHTAGGRARLLRYQAEEDNCLDCHDGSVATKNVSSELTKFGSHRVSQYINIHDPAEDPATMSEHVECADCHNPHQMTATGSASAPNIKPTMKGASGYTRFGASVSPANYEYEVCYKCHAVRNPATPVVDRVDHDNNIANELDPGNVSYHPVVAQGRNSSVPSLILPWRTTSMVYCTDCHGSDGNTVKGPHGSAFSPLLVKNYDYHDPSSESPQAYALCYTCHNRDSILANQSFSEHNRHVAEKKTSCAICHDPHGSRTNKFMINFDRTVVTATSGGQGPTYTSTGLRSGTCTLRCHNVDHNNKAYPDH
ncbi:MAG: hypothetical protein BIFFINMI_03144 [Phycisphaerae bacterium]|nr:hypothetical protein [Phycisphaerae bacterium]